MVKNHFLGSSEYTLSIKRNLSLLQSDIHRNPLHQNDSYLDTDYVNSSLISTSKKTRVYFNQRGDKWDELARGKFSKITETACLSGWEFEADNGLYGIYVARHWNWMFWIGRLRGACSELARWAVSAIFDKITFRYLNAFFSFLTRKILCFLDILIKEY